jgi:RHS repeat-associated protein
VLASYGYDNASNLTATAYQNTVTSSYVYDAGNRLTSLGHYSYLMSAATTNPLSFPSTLASFNYTYDNMNHRTGAFEGQGTVTYGYDKLYRLKSVQYPSTGPVSSMQTHRQDYTYDPAGNRLTLVQQFEGQTASLSYSYHAGTNEMYQYKPTPTQTLSYQYDRVGNMIFNAGKYMHYDAADHLIDSDSDQPTVPLQFKYGGDGQRISRKLGVRETILITDGLNTLAEIDNSLKKPVAVYAYGADGLVLKDHYYPDDSYQAYPASAQLAAERSFYHRNGLGSVALTTDIEGKAQERFDYDPFGQVLGGSTQRNKHTFTGKESEDNIGLFYFNARWMDASVGRFTQVDPVVGDAFNTQDWNQYAYVGNDPINMIDPTGMWSWSEIAQDVEIYVKAAASAVSAGVCGIAQAVADAWQGSPDPNSSARIETSVTKSGVNNSTTPCKPVPTLRSQDKKKKPVGDNTGKVEPNGYCHGYWVMVGEVPGTDVTYADTSDRKNKLNGTSTLLAVTRPFVLNRTCKWVCLDANFEGRLTAGQVDAQTKGGSWNFGGSPKSGDALCPPPGGSSLGLKPFAP